MKYYLSINTGKMLCACLQICIIPFYFFYFSDSTPVSHIKLEWGEIGVVMDIDDEQQDFQIDVTDYHEANITWNNMGN